MYKKLYLKSLELAAHKSSEFYLALVSFIESSFFPIPPDVMIVPMVMARKDRFIRIFLNATIFSVLGGIFGYFIGFIFSDLAMSVVEFYNYENKWSFDGFFSENTPLDKNGEPLLFLNVGTGRDISIRELAKKILKIL